MDTAVTDLAAAAAGLTELKEQGLAPMQEIVNDLKDQVRRKCGDGRWEVERERDEVHCAVLCVSLLP